MLPCFLLFSVITAWSNAKPLENTKNDVVISEQLDPRFLIHQGTLYPANIYGQPNSIYNQFPTNQVEMSAQRGINFDFRCRCNAKVNRNTTPKPSPVPQDANSQAQQQIQQLQEQLRQQSEQLRRQQQLASQGSGFEQFANLLSIADGLDCSCSGVAPNMNQQALLQQQGLVGTQQYLHPNMGGVPLTSPFNTPLMPLQTIQTGPLFP